MGILGKMHFFEKVKNRVSILAFFYPPKTPLFGTFAWSLSEAPICRNIAEKSEIYHYRVVWHNFSTLKKVIKLDDQMANSSITASLT